MPIKPLEASPTVPDHRMDQRNAGRSTRSAGDPDPWQMYAEDQLAVLDQLGVDKRMVIGSVHGSSFIFELIELAPRAGRRRYLHAADRARRDQRRRPSGPRCGPRGQNLIDKGASFAFEDVDAFGHALFASDRLHRHARRVEVLPDTAAVDVRQRPRTSARRFGGSRQLLPNVQIIQEWKDEAVVPKVIEQMRSFLRAHRLVSAR